MGQAGVSSRAAVARWQGEIHHQWISSSLVRRPRVAAMCLRMCREWPWKPFCIIASLTQNKKRLNDDVVQRGLTNDHMTIRVAVAIPN